MKFAVTPSVLTPFRPCPSAPQERRLPDQAAGQPRGGRPEGLRERGKLEESRGNF